MSSQSTQDSTSRDGPGPRPRRSSGQAATDRLTARKRAQNRISQQCARERQATYIRQLESVIDVLKTNSQRAAQGSGNDDGTQQNTELLQAYLALIDEKQDLEDSLLRFRQKLLSLGNLAASAAEDAIFDQLKKPFAQPNDPLPQPTGELSSLITSNAFSGLDSQHVSQAGLGSKPLPPALFPSESTAIDPLEFTTGDDGTNNERHLEWITSGQFFEHPSAPLFGQHGQPDVSVTGPVCPSVPDLPSPWAKPASQFPFGTFDINAAPSTFNLAWNVPVPSLLPVGDYHLGDAIVIANSTIFADQVKSAARHVMAQSSTGLQPQSHVVNKLVSTAVEVIGALAGLEPYIYGVDFSSYMECVMRWRISDSQQDRLAVPPPFRPTPLQFTTPHHPMVVDFINWPSIRDQMILYSAHLDLDTMARDIVLNTVVELPLQHVAVNIYDVFFTHILPQVRGPSAEGKNSMLYNPGWIYLKVPTTPTTTYFPANTNPTQAALAAEITARMDLLDANGFTHSHGPATSSLGGTAPSPTHSRLATHGPRMTVSRALLHLGIDQPGNWKLSKDFARKYSFIDCSLDVSRYDMKPCSSVKLDANLDM